MTLYDSLWIAIRAFGIFLLVHALFELPSVVSSCLLFAEIGRMESVESLKNVEPLRKPPLSDADFDHFIRNMRVNAFENFGSSLFAFLLYGATGLYMVRGGYTFFKWIIPPEFKDDPANQNEALPKGQID